MAGDCAWFNSADWTSLFDIAVGTPASIARSSSPTARELYERVKVATLAGGRRAPVAQHHPPMSDTCPLRGR